MRPGAGLPKPAHRAYSSESFKIKLRQSCSRRTAEQSSSVNHTGEDHEGFAEERLDRRCRRKRGARRRLWPALRQGRLRSEEHTSELQSLMRTSYAVFGLKKKTANSTL